MSRNEFYIRLLLLFPLVVITVQILMLRRLLRSRAWTMLAVGFVIFTIVRVGTVLISPFPAMPALIVYLAGYGIVAYGFLTLHRDLLRVLHSVDETQKRNRRKEDPK